MNEVKRMIPVEAAAELAVFPGWTAVLEGSENRIYIAPSQFRKGGELDNTELSAIVLPAGSGRLWANIAGALPGMEEHLATEFPVLKKLLPAEMATERKVGYHTAMLLAVRDIFASLGYVDGDLGMTASNVVALVEGLGKESFDIDELFRLIGGMMEHSAVTVIREEEKEPAATEGMADDIEIYYSSRYGASITVSGLGSTSSASLTSGTEAEDIRSAFRSKNTDGLDMQLYVSPETVIRLQINGTQISAASKEIFRFSVESGRMIMPADLSEALSRYVSVIAGDMMAGISLVKSLVGMTAFYREEI